MIKRNKHFLGALVALTLPLLVAGPSTAATVQLGASAGTAYFASELEAFKRNDYNRIYTVSTWAPGRYWTIDLPFSTIGSKSFTAYGLNSGSTLFGSATSCAAVRTSPNGGLSAWTGHVILTNGSSGTFLGSLTMSGGQGAQIECFISTTSTGGVPGYVSLVTYTQ